MIQPQPEAWVLESPLPTAMGTQSSRIEQRSRWMHHLRAPLPRLLTASEAGLKKPLHRLWWVTAECITVLHLKETKGPAVMWISTASSAERRGHFKTALKAARAEQTDKLYAAVWQADGEGLVLCTDLPMGYEERLHYHHPPPLTQTYIKSPLTPQHHYLRLWSVATGFMCTSSPLQDDRIMRQITFPATVWVWVLTVNVENERRSYGNCWLTVGSCLTPL